MEYVSRKCQEKVRKENVRKPFEMYSSKHTVIDLLITTKTDKNGI